MSREYVLQFAVDEAAKAIEGKHIKNKLVNVCKSVAAMAYRNGTDDAWELARNMFCVTDDRDMPPEILNDPIRALAEHSFEEVNDTVNEYHEKQQELVAKPFVAGDEIRDIETGEVGVILSIDSGNVAVLWSDGSFNNVYGTYLRTGARRTGRYFEDIAKVLYDMRIFHGEHGSGISHEA